MFPPPSRRATPTTSRRPGSARDVERAKKISPTPATPGSGGAGRPGRKPVPAMRIRYTVGNAIRQNESELFAGYMRQLPGSTSLSS
ncbi:hypothetical protein HBB16_20605 [Pseudonocardia sp. MCCB 268]|nr:hypothetical protein [Pseudonocardia cytotoxica]